MTVWAADDVFQLTGLSETILFENMKVFYSKGFCTNIRNLLQILFGQKALRQILFVRKPFSEKDFGKKFEYFSFKKLFVKNFFLVENDVFEYYSFEKHSTEIICLKGICLEVNCLEAICHTSVFLNIRPK